MKTMRGWMVLMVIAVVALGSAGAADARAKTCPVARHGHVVARGRCRAVPRQRAHASTLAALRARLLAATNATRARYGLAPVRENALLDQAAQTYVNRLAQTTVLVHDLNGSRIGDRVTATGYPWQWVGENLACGQGTPEEAITAWLNSATGHREILLSSWAQAVGFGEATRAGCSPIWDMTMARPQ